MSSRNFIPNASKSLFSIKFNQAPQVKFLLLIPTDFFGVIQKHACSKVVILHIIIISLNMYYASLHFKNLKTIFIASTCIKSILLTKLKNTHP